MKKVSTHLLFLAAFAIISLLGLAAFLALYISPASSAEPAAPSGNVPEAQIIEPNNSVNIGGSKTLANGDADYTVPSHSYIFVGDSRTVGMSDAILKANDGDTCAFIAKSGEGFDWLAKEGVAELKTALDTEPDASVILNLGVNDLKEVEQYTAFYEELFSAYSSSSFYIMSVNPVDEEIYQGVSNADIEAFNHTMQDTFPDKYLDCYNYLLSEGLKTTDGLHYTDSTYYTIHHYAIICLEK